MALKAFSLTGFVFTCAVLAAATRVEAISTRVGILSDATPQLEKFQTAVESSASSANGFALIDHEKIAAAMKEQELKEAAGPEGLTTRIKLGKTLQADVLVIMRLVKEPKEALNITVCETGQGLRLYSSVLPVDAKAEAVHAEVERISQALERAKLPFREIVAVPPLECKDLSLKYGAMSGGYARLIEEGIMRDPTVQVVEIAEARVLAREIRAGEKFKRPLPAYMIGEFRNDGVGDDRRMTLKLAMKRGETELGSKSAEHVKPDEAPAKLVEMALDLVGAKKDAIAVQPDPAQEAKELLARGQSFLLVSQFDEALELCTASLLLKEDPVAHLCAAHAIVERAVDVRDREPHPNETFQMQQEREERWIRQYKADFAEGLAHAEAYAKVSPQNGNLPDFPVLLLRINRMEDVREMLIRVFTARRDAPADNCFRAVEFLDFTNAGSTAENYETAYRLSQFAARDKDSLSISGMMSRVDGFKETPELTATLTLMAKSDNRFVVNAGQRISQMIAAQNAPQVASTQKQPPKPVAVEAVAAESSLKIIDLPIDGEFGGIMPTIPGVDVAWGCVHDEDYYYPYTLYTVPRPGAAKAQFEFHRRSRVIWDGKYVWAAGPGKDATEIIVFDPATGKHWTIGEKQGLPADKILNFAGDKLGQGKIIAAASIGTDRAYRTWLGILTFDEAQGGSVSIFHEARQSRMAPNADKNSIDTAFAPTRVTVFRSPTKETPDRKLAAFLEGPRQLVAEVQGDKARVLPTVTLGKAGGTAIVHDEKVDYMYRIAKESWVMSDPTKGFSAFPGALKAEGVDLDVAADAKHVYAFSRFGKKLFVISVPDGTVRGMATKVPDEIAHGYMGGTEGVLYTSQHYGLVATFGHQAAQLVDAAGKPIGGLPVTVEAVAGAQPEKALPAPEKILAMPAKDAFAAIVGMLAAGQQEDAEVLLAQLVEKYPNDQPLLFALAACTRSRFDVPKAYERFEAARKLDEKSVEGQCAHLMMQIDAKRDEKSFKDLCTLADANKEHPFVIWMAGVACRVLEKNAEGVTYYRILQGLLDPGPPLLHQTFGNLLDETGAYKEALVHREITVKMEPAGWSYQGLANTLANLEQYEKADKAYAEAVRLAPDSALYWETWGHTLREWGHYNDAIAKLEKAAILDPDYVKTWINWGMCLEAKKEPALALEKYEKAIELDPTDPEKYEQAATVLTSMGKKGEAEEMRRRADAVRKAPGH